MSSSTKFCPVCKSAGKPESEYTSHHVKDAPNGTVICPTLLNQECKYCHEMGHTPKFCPKLKTKEERAKKPFCAVCHKSGKPESVYTSHFVKDSPGPNGKVVCPTLLAQECRYCHKKGHTPKFCPKLDKKRLHEPLVDEASSYRSSQATFPMSANQQRQVEKARRSCCSAAATRHFSSFPLRTDTLLSDCRPAPHRHPTGCCRGGIGLGHGESFDQTDGTPPRVHFAAGTWADRARDGPHHQTPIDAFGLNPTAEEIAGWREPAARTPPPPERKLVTLFIPPPHSHAEMQKQQMDEEDVSLWAGRSTAYTAEEEAAAEAEMEAEAEFQNDMDALNKGWEVEARKVSRRAAIAVIADRERKRGAALSAGMDTAESGDVFLQADGYMGTKSEYLGLFKLQEEVEHGRPTYKMSGKEQFLFYTTYGLPTIQYPRGKVPGYWMVGPNTNKVWDGAAGFWLAKSMARTPDTITEPWKVLALGVWTEVPTAKIVRAEVEVYAGDSDSSHSSMPSLISASDDDA